MKRTGLWQLALAGAALALAWSPAAAQDSTTQTAEIVVQQKLNQETFNKLVGTMAELARLLKDKQPEAARALEEALKAAQSAFIAQDMDKVIDLLSKGLSIKAADKEQDVIKNLQAVLETLRRGQMSLEKTDQWIKDLEAMRDKVREYKKEERKLNNENQSTSRPAAQRAEELGRQIDALAAEQKKLMEETAASQGDPNVQKLVGLRDAVRALLAEQAKVANDAANMPIDKLPVAGAVENKLAEKADATAGKAGEAAKDAALAKAIAGAGGDPNAVAGAGKQTSDAAGEMRKAAGALSSSEASKAEKPQAAAGGDLAKADELLSGLIDKMTPGTKSGDLAKKQSELEDKTRSVAKAAEELANAVAPKDAASQPSGKPGETPTGKPGETPSGKPGETPSGKPGETPSGKPGESASGKPGESSSGKPGESAGGKPGESPSGQPKPPQNNVQKAAEEMAKAGDKLSQQDPNKALPHQAKAIENLESFKKYELAQLHRMMKESEPRPPKDQAKDQKELGKKTDDLAGDMQKASSKSPDGKSTPGQQSVQSAKSSMDQASSKMDQGKQDEADQPQKKAVDDLAKAEDELDKAIDKAKDDRQDKELEKIEEKLAKILETQKNVSVETKKSSDKLIAAKDGDKSELRTVELKLTNDLAPGEGALAVKVQEVNDMLKQEDATVVFPEMLGVVKKDLLDVQKRLAAKDPGTLTQAVQTEIERNLQAMIDSIKETLMDRREKKKSGGGGGGGGGGGKQPLVPPIAELKMLRMMQLQINSRTNVLDQQAAAKALPKDQVDQQAKELSDREARVKKLADETAAKLNRPPPPDVQK
jgi:hypothetical protein